MAEMSEVLSTQEASFERRISLHILVKKEATDCVFESRIVTHEESTHGEATSPDLRVYDRFAILTIHPIS